MTNVELNKIKELVEEYYGDSEWALESAISEFNRGLTLEEIEELMIEAEL